ncbi:MAG: 30S ribosomal protein S9 [Candidatus Woesearchaeota archaeon]
MKSLQTSGRRKQAIARAVISPGKGVVRVNSIVLDNYGTQYQRLRIQEPVMLADKFAKKLDISVDVQGGGVTGQTDAVRLAIARALVDHTKSDELKNTFLHYDRQLLVADVRVKEASKPNSHGKARAKRQKSYR